MCIRDSNTTWHEVAAGALAARRPAAAFRWVRERCAVITATADGTMTHDQGWNFLVLGRSLERVDMTARLVEAAALRGGLAAWTSALRAGGAHHAFVRSHHDQDAVPDAAEFLLMNRAFPRSIVHSPVSYTHLDVYKRQHRWSGAALPAGHLAAAHRLRQLGARGAGAGPAGAGLGALPR